MTNAKVTDKDRRAAEAAIDEAIRRQDEGEDRGVENAYAQAIANARAEGRQEVLETIREVVRTNPTIPGLWKVSPHESGRQTGLRQAADYVKSFPGLKAHVLAILALKETP